MATIARMNVMLGMDSKDFERGVKDAEAAGESLSNKLGKIGQNMTAGVTLPIMGAAAAALKFSTDLNTSMANIASLGVANDRVVELKGNIQDMAVRTGKSTDDLAQGAYQVISAFGDTAETAAILEINAKSAAAGLADTSEAIALTSAVTKGYGDTSAKAVQQASDLALQTVALGQTTFPELAGSIGAVTPLAANLGVAQQELFAVMATGTGVTGNASAVATQMRGTLQSLMAPTESMTELMTSMGYETAQAMIEGEGYQGTMAAILAAAKASDTPLQSYIGSIEGQTLALALGGPLADSYAEKLTAMGGAVGATDKAFAAQTQGINKAGFTMKQLAIKAQVVAQKIGDGLAPALASVFDIVTPLVDKVIELADLFSQADAATQTWIVGAVALVAALGPILAIMPAIATAIGVLFSPVGLVIAAVVALGTAWATNFGGIQTITSRVIGTLVEVFADISETITSFSEGYLDTTELIWNIGNALTGGNADYKTISNAINAIEDAIDSVRPAFNELLSWIDLAMKGDFSGLWTEVGAALTSVQVAVSEFDWADYITTTLSDWGTYVTKLDWGGYIKTALDWGTYITMTLSDWGTYVTKLDWGGYIKTALDWGTYISKLWTGYVPKLSWGDYVSKLNWSDYATKLDWTLWIPALVWTVVITPVRWASWIPQLLWDNVISKFSWSGFIQAITNWDTWISMLQWSTLVFPVLWPAFIDKLGVTQWIEAIGKSPQWSSFISKLSWLAVIPGFNWPTWVTSLDWNTFVSKLLWPAIEAPTWLDFIDKLKWPELKAPKWEDFIPDLSWPKIDAFPGWTDILRALGWGGPPAGAPGTSTTSGTPIDVTKPAPQTYIDPVTGEVVEVKGRGGPVSSGVPYIVGEKGAEMFVPNISGTIIPNHELSGWMDNLAGAGAGGAGLNIGQVAVYNDVDLRALAYQVAGYMNRRR